MADISIPPPGLPSSSTLPRDCPPFLPISSTPTWPERADPCHQPFGEKVVLEGDTSQASNHSTSNQSNSPNMSSCTSPGDEESIIPFDASPSTSHDSAPRRKAHSPTDAVAHPDHDTGSEQPSANQTSLISTVSLPLPGMAITPPPMNESETNKSDSGPMEHNAASAGWQLGRRHSRPPEGDLNTNFSFPMGGNQPQSAISRRMDDLYLETHKPPTQARKRSPRLPPPELKSGSTSGTSISPFSSPGLTPSYGASPVRNLFPANQVVGDSRPHTSGHNAYETHRPSSTYNLGPPIPTPTHRHRRSAALSISYTSNDGSQVMPSPRPFGSAPTTPSELHHNLTRVENAMPQDNIAGSCHPTEAPPSPLRHESTISGPRRRQQLSSSFQPRPLSTILSDSGSISSLEKDKKSGSLGSFRAITAAIDEAANTSIDAALKDDALSSGASEDATSSEESCTGHMGVTSVPSTPEKAESSIQDSVVTPDSVRNAWANPSRQPGFEHTPTGDHSRRRPHHTRAGSSGEPVRPRTSPGRAQSEHAEQSPLPLTGFPASQDRPTQAGATHVRDTQSSASGQFEDVDLLSMNFDEENSTTTLDLQPNSNSQPSVSRRSVPQALQHVPRDAAIMPSDPFVQSPSSDEYPTLVDQDVSLDSPRESGRNLMSSSAAAAFQRRMRMHSSGGRGGFACPTQYHRRTESAPEMPPPSFAINRMGSNADMADVFEEDEEEQRTGMELVGGREPASDEASNEVTETDCQPTTNSVSLKNEAATETKDSAGTVTPRPTPEQTNDSATALGTQEVQVFDDMNWNAAVARSSDSTMTPGDVEETPVKRPASAPMDIAIRRHGSFVTPSDLHSSGSNSAYPSPDPASVSFEPPRLLTATSSITDRGTFASGISGDNHWGLRGSVDRTPDLTEDDDSMLTGAIPRHSSSAITNGSHTDHRQSTPSGPPPGSPIRPGRYSMGAKRGSFASLTRFMTPPGSKLRNEEKVPDDSTEQCDGKKKKRFSRRLMGIFKK